jgi:hypothetical protein
MPDYDPYYNGQNCLRFHVKRKLPVGTVLRGIGTHMTRLPHYKVGADGVLLKDYSPGDDFVLVDWGPSTLGDKTGWANTEAMVVVREEDQASLRDWVRQRQEQLANPQLGTCKRCGKPWKGVVSFYLEDPELSAQDHKPPKVGYKAKCCGARCTEKDDFSVKQDDLATARATA